MITRLARSVKALQRDYSSMDEVQLIIYNWKSQGAFFGLEQTKPAWSFEGRFE